MSSIGNIFQQTNPYEKFVQQLVQLESRKKYLLEIKQGEHRERKTALGEVSSVISKFTSKITELENPANNSLKPLKTSSTDESTVMVNSAVGIDRPSSYQITVDRLASRDKALSQVRTGGTYELASFGSGSVDITIGDLTETITVETTKDDGSGTLVDKTNKEILNSFADAVNSKFGNQASAAVFQVNDTDVQLSVQSLESGFDQRIQLGSSTGVASELIGGITHVVPQSELNALFTIDGVNFERSQNTVDDAISGLSFTLKKATGISEQMIVERDLEKARKNIDEFISSFNKMNKTIRDRTFIDAENDRRGALQDMRAVRNLTMDLRQTALLPMEGVADGELSRFSDIGIDFKKDGTMYVEDEALLDKMLSERSDEVSQLFMASDSTVAKMKATAESYTKSGGIISTLDSGLDQKIDRLDNRIAAEERYLVQYEERQREQFNKLQRIIDQGEAQYNQVMNFQSRIGL